MEQDGEDEEDPDGEEHRRRIAANAEPAGDRVQTLAPGGEHGKRDAGDEPEQRVALAQPAAADQLEHDEDEHERRDRTGDRDG